jgi:hypothetical protein
MSERLLNLLPKNLGATVEALVVDLHQDLHRVPGPLSDIRWRTPAFNHVDTQECRRSYGVSANGDSATSPVKTAFLALRQSRLMVPFGSSSLLRSPVKVRPATGGNSRMCS